MVFPEKQMIDLFFYYPIHVFYKEITWNVHVKNMESFKIKEG